MRLLCAKTLQFLDIRDGATPKYAILSHKWRPPEVSYQDMCIATGRKPGAERRQKRRSFKKIKNSARQASKDGYEYIWVDTCCIDQSSSADLQEAINSMYEWYQNSEVCYAYLDDVSVSSEGAQQYALNSRPASWMESFQSSEWFTRGWTLQELLAPRELVFFDKHWRECDSSDLTMAIQTITGISSEHFSKGGNRSRLWEVRVARRMAWAAKRETTLIEDSAYSLLGLFDVHMPMIYGERQRAFQRLQEEILNIDEDASILAWSYIDTDTDFAPNGLAKSPAHFQRYPDLVQYQRSQESYVDFNAAMTPRGLRVTLNIWKDSNDQALAYAVLMDTPDRYSPYKPSARSLVLPIMFTRSTFVRSNMKNECVRFSDPLWVSSAFVRTARPTTLCFIRHVAAADVRRSCSGFSLDSRVWAQYTTSFTYPLQTRPGRRHATILFGGLPTSAGENGDHRTLVWELVARTESMDRFGILVDYRITDRTLVSDHSVTVIKLSKPMNLPWAWHLAKDRTYRCRHTCWDLVDGIGRTIPRDKIVHVGSFQGYWTRAGDDELDELSMQPVMSSVTKEIGYVGVARLIDEV